MVYVLETRDEKDRVQRVRFFAQGNGQAISHTSSYVNNRRLFKDAGMMMGFDDHEALNQLEQLCDYKVVQREYEQRRVW